MSVQIDPTQILIFFDNSHLGIVAILLVAKVVIRLRVNKITQEPELERFSSDDPSLTSDALEYF